MSRKSTKCQKMLKNGFDRFKFNHFGFVLYKNTLRIHFWCLLEAKSMVLLRFFFDFDIRSTVMVKNCIDIIFEGLRDIWISVFWLFFHYILLFRAQAAEFPASCLVGVGHGSCAPPRLRWDCRRFEGSIASSKPELTRVPCFGATYQGLHGTL